MDTVEGHVRDPGLCISRLQRISICNNILRGNIRAVLCKYLILHSRHVDVKQMVALYVMMIARQAGGGQSGGRASGKAGRRGGGTAGGRADGRVGIIPRGGIRSFERK